MPLPNKEPATDAQQSALYIVYMRSFDRYTFQKEHPENLEGFGLASESCAVAEGEAAALGIPDTLIRRAAQMGFKDVRDKKDPKSLSEITGLMR